MPSYALYMWGLKITWLLFAMAFGACVGSLVNVIAYRMPRGINIIWPPSRCPSCNTRLTWRENIPVFGWLFLRGKCRFCQGRISPEYPIVEATVAAIFGLFYIVYYMIPDHAVLLGVDWGLLKPEWVTNDAAVTWPGFVLLLILLGSLAAMTIVDAKTYTIPLPLTWFPAALALLVHPIHAAVIGGYARTAQGWDWSIAAPGPNGWPWIGVAIGATIGLIASNILLSARLITRSFADYEDWEKEHKARSVPVAPAAGESPVPEPVAVPVPSASDDPSELWIEYPHARREMLKEILFLALPMGLGAIGWIIADHWAGVRTFSPLSGTFVYAHQAPLWLNVLTGVLLGYLIGGGVVWLVRIFGSLAFGREAMGLGDVHLMAAVGACLGWIDATLAFFGAAFVGLFFAIVGRLFSGVFKRAMPYGPYLAIATVLVLLTKFYIEHGLTAITRSPVPIDIP